jgi:hypothetical protein
MTPRKQAGREEHDPVMADTSPEYRRLTQEELGQLTGEELPERAAMSLVNANIAIPVNAAIAANVLSDGAVAYADAVQATPIDQSN